MNLNQLLNSIFNTINGLKLEWQDYDLLIFLLDLNLPNLSYKIMQVSSKNIPEKNMGFDRQIHRKENHTVTGLKSQTLKNEDILIDSNTSERNETSQYLKVLSRIENLIIQEKLPDAAIDGFIGAVKKQLDELSEKEIQMLMKMPAISQLGIQSLDELTDIIKNDIRDLSKNSVLLGLLRDPKFADLMQSKSNPSAKTYSAQTIASEKPAQIDILDIPRANEKQDLPSSQPRTNDNIAYKKTQRS